MRSNPHAGRAGDKKANRPLLQPPARRRMRLIPAIFSRGHRRSGQTQKGGVNGAGLIAFPKRSIAGAKREIFSIADRGPARIARKPRAYIESPKRKSRLFYLPRCPPDRDPDELAWKHLKAATAGRGVIANKPGFQRKVRSSMRQLQYDAKKIISFFRNRSRQAAAGMSSYL